ncbi:hypothetical protein F5Y11DRAFT_133057 [Daldinia sp. FL1419]|nr:hypothetical protein F5Y11DRAFT_133057 [Daldinia sp. FL1419]
MGLDEKFGKMSNHLLKLPTGLNHDRPVSSLAEDDEIPLDSSSGESDVSMSDSEPEDVHNSLISSGNEQIPGQTPLPGSSAQDSEHISRKRKSQEVDIHRAIALKKVKLDDEGSDQTLSVVTCPLDKSLLPAEIWHRIFTFTPPRALGNLLRVNKLFNVYLDPSSTYQCKFPSSLSQSSPRLSKPDAIWQLSRRRFWPRMPTPLQQKTELDMWRLACGRRCQFCGKFCSSLASFYKQSNHRNQPIWPFALRSCESCLEEKATKEIDLLLSSTPSFLTSALPFTFITDKKQIISPGALRKGVAQPDMQVTKIFLSEHVEKLNREFLSAKAMGGATAEEWLKGLEARGKELLNDTIRWEKWASTGGVTQMQNQMSPDIGLSVTIPNNKGQASADYSLTPKTLSNSSSIARRPPPDPGHVASISIAQSVHNPEATSPYGLGASFSSLPVNTQYNGSRTRTKEEALELKAARRIEIERRALELNPPLLPNILTHMPAFQAAIQIIKPLDDHAWGLLKPRLLAQKVAAEQRERREQGGSSAQSGLVLDPFEDQGEGEENIIATKQRIDKTWDDVQEPLRAQISAFTDEIIRDSWNDGRSIDTDNSPQFAADVLLSVRQRFYAEIEKEVAAARAANRELPKDPPGGPFTQKLTLENMKWLFDVKIKPHTESYRKELFFCNGCEISVKAFGFEGVIQHYAAKHTGALSQGSVVVYWRAEWPEIPPFKPDPCAIKAAPPLLSACGNIQSQSNTYRRNAGTHSGPNPPLFKPSPYAPVPPGYGHPAYGPATQQPTSYGHGNPYIQGPHEYGTPYPIHAPPYTPRGTPYPSSHLPFSPGMQTESSDYPLVATPYPNHNYNTPQNSSHIHYQDPHGNYFASKYRTELEYLARSSRELWNSTAGLKELPGNIRVYVVIYHVVQRFRSRFSETPSLSMFIDGLSNNKEMRPVRNINGLMCKACHLSLSSDAPTEQDLKAFSLPQLVNHFKQRHVDQPQVTGVPFLDWTINMVHIPDLSALHNLQYLTRMDSQKSSLICGAFPSAQYPDGHLWSVSTSGTREDVETAAFPGQQPTDNKPTLLYPIFGRDETNRGVQQDPAQAITLGRRADIDQPIGSPALTVRQKIQRSDSGRSSSGILQGGNPSRTKKQRRSSAKDRRNASSQGPKNQKSGALDIPARIESQDHSEADLITEEERRREEVIRAMWAADRKGTALVASKNNPPSQSEEPDIPNSKSRIKSSQSPYGPPAQSIGPSAHAAWAQRPVLAQEVEEDDLMAGLQSQLDRQQVSSEHFGRQLRHDDDLHRGRQTSYGKYIGSEQHSFSDRGCSYNKVNPSEYVSEYVRQESGPRLDQYRGNSADHRAIKSTHGFTRTTTPLDETLYDRLPHQEYYHAYPDDSHQPFPEYAIAYEVVRIRDSHGEFFIRRPIRLEQEPTTYTTSQNEPAPYTIPHTDTAARYGSYGNDDSNSRLGCEPDLRTESSLRQPTCESAFRTGGLTKRTYEMVSEEDSHGYNEYDLRYSARLPAAEVARRARYQ